MITAIPKIMLYRRQVCEPEENISIPMPDNREAWCFFSRPNLALAFRRTLPDTKDEEGWEVSGPLTDQEFRQRLDSVSGHDFIALNPDAENLEVIQCIQVSALREVVDRGESEGEFERRATGLKGPAPTD